MRVDKVSECHVLTPLASPCAACVIPTQQHCEAPATVQLLPIPLQLHPALCFSLSFIYVLNIEIFSTKEITLTANLDRGFPVVKILGTIGNEWLYAKDNGTYGQKTSYNSQAFLTYQEYDNHSTSGGWEYMEKSYNFFISLFCKSLPLHFLLIKSICPIFFLPVTFQQVWCDQGLHKVPHHKPSKTATSIVKGKHLKGSACWSNWFR